MTKQPYKPKYQSQITDQVFNRGLPQQRQPAGIDSIDDRARQIKSDHPEYSWQQAYSEAQKGSG